MFCAYCDEVLADNEVEFCNKCRKELAHQEAEYTTEYDESLKIFDYEDD